MILLNAVNRRLQVLLGGAGVIPFLACYVDVTTATATLSAEAANPGQTNGATPVDLVPVPGAGVVRQVKYVSIRNSTGATVVVTVRYDDNGTSRDFVWNLAAGSILQYTDGHGWVLFDGSGATSITVSGTLTTGGGIPTPDEGVLNGTTWVTAVAAPAASKTRKVTSLLVYNRDTVQHTIKGRKSKGGSHYEFFNADNIQPNQRALIITSNQPMGLNATDETIEVQSDAAATTTEPMFDSYAEEA
jgi:hypothetical protein